MATYTISSYGCMTFLLHWLSPVGSQIRSVHSSLISRLFLGRWVHRWHYLVPPYGFLDCLVPFSTLIAFCPLLLKLHNQPMNLKFTSNHFHANTIITIMLDHKITVLDLTCTNSYHVEFVKLRRAELAIYGTPFVLSF